MMKTCFFLFCLLPWLSEEKMELGEMIEGEKMVVGEMVEDEGEGSVRLATIYKGRGKKMARNLQRLVSHSTVKYHLRPACYPYPCSS